MPAQGETHFLLVWAAAGASSPPPPADPERDNVRDGRGRGLAMTGELIDVLHIDRRVEGTTVTVTHRLARPARLLTARRPSRASHPDPRRSRHLLTCTVAQPLLPLLRHQGADQTLWPGAMQLDDLHKVTLTGHTCERACFADTARPEHVNGTCQPVRGAPIPGQTQTLRH